METVEASEATTSTQPPGKRRLKFVVVLGVMLLIAGAIALFVYKLNTPAEGVISTPPASRRSTPPPITVYGKTVKFSYSGVIKRATPNVLATGDVEKFLFTHPRQASWSLAIQIKQLPGGVLTNDSNYNLRKQNPQQYIEQKQTVNGMPVSIMLDQSGTHNKVAFITHRQLVGEIALSGSNDDTQTQDIFDDVLKSWQWL